MDQISFRSAFRLETWSTGKTALGSANEESQIVVTL